MEACAVHQGCSEHILWVVDAVWERDAGRQARSSPEWAWFARMVEVQAACAGHAGSGGGRDVRFEFTRAVCVLCVVCCAGVFSAVWPG